MYTVLSYGLRMSYRTKTQYSEPLKASVAQSVSTSILWGTHLISSITYLSLQYEQINYQGSK